MAELTRRTALHALAAASVACSRKQSSSSGSQQSIADSSDAESSSRDDSKGNKTPDSGASSVVKNTFALAVGRPWPTPDPFLFCVHHDDRYPRGNGTFGPAASLDGRQMGRDFAWKDGWNMYHGREVPGFPAHPHRGFETVTVVRQGRLDHADSLGAAARYGDGDVQWLTAGRGIQHAEMFPLLKEDEDNPLDLFQIWLNLPARKKMVEPRFAMLWADTIPEKSFTDEEGKRVTVTARAGKISGITAPSPPADSWAADPSNDVGIFTIALEPGAQWTLPAASSVAVRNLYFFKGTSLAVGSHSFTKRQGGELIAARSVKLRNTGSDEAEVLILQGRPIGEPVAKNGPFVMNSQAEVRQAYADYRETRFGGWPWKDSSPVHGRDPARFARRVDGREEKPG